ncbi:MAG: hypothetical protein HYX74_08925 [Acidobacteria bacterium]|nr:hypothetical protein [Acidobacteriota bacterium]
MLPEERKERIERMDRLLEFLANQQAEALARVERHQQEIERHSQQIERNSQQIEQLGGFLLRTARLLESLAQRTDERFQQVAQVQQRTDERLNVLIGVVERYFSNGDKR